MPSSRTRRKYIPAYLSAEDKRRQARSIRRGTDRPELKSAKTRRSSWVTKYERKYGRPITDRAFIEKHLLKKAGVDKILGKGRAAYYTSGSRPNQTNHSWAYARLASVILGGPARKVDAKEWEKYKR